MKYKLFISDYDGTLGKAPQNEIDPETVAAIKKYVCGGGIFAVCSGRPFVSVRKILRRYSIKGLAVSLQGAMINDVETGETIMEGGIDSDAAARAVKIVKDGGYICLAYVNGYFYYDKPSEYIEHYERNVHKGFFVPDLAEYVLSEKRAVGKVMAIGPQEEIIKFREKYSKRFSQEGLMVNSGASIVAEIVNPAFDKGFAVRYLSDYYKIPHEEILAVGDSSNDMPLICGDWHGVAVADGDEALKKAAKEIAPPFSEKPVKTLLEKYTTI